MLSWRKSWVLFIIFCLLLVMLPFPVRGAGETWESYREVGHTNVWGTTDPNNPYSSTYHTIYMYGEGYTNGQSYAVGFYDGASTKLGSDVSGSLVGTNLSCQFEISNHHGSTPGLWHAVVFDTASGSPPATYAECSTAPGYVVEDSFEVAADAVPEFPALFSVIGVSGLCLGIYYLMRRRRQGHAFIKA